MAGLEKPPVGAEGELRVGVLGGSFNPVHEGHIAFARFCVGQLGLRECVLVPTSDSYHKILRPYVPAAKRLHMCGLAVAGDPSLTVSDAEASLARQPATAETVALLAARFPGARLYLLLGDDVAASAPYWEAFDSLRESVVFAVAKRGDSWDRRLARLRQSGARCVWLEGWRGGGVSSSRIRESLRGFGGAAGLPPGLPPGVLRYILRENLYDTERSPHHHEEKEKRHDENDAHEDPRFPAKAAQRRDKGRARRDDQCPGHGGGQPREMVVHQNRAD